MNLLCWLAKYGIILDRQKPRCETEVLHYLVSHLPLNSKLQLSLWFTLQGITLNKYDLQYAQDLQWKHPVCQLWQSSALPAHKFWCKMARLFSSTLSTPTPNVEICNFFFPKQKLALKVTLHNITMFQEQLWTAHAQHTPPAKASNKGKITKTSLHPTVREQQHKYFNENSTKQTAN
jgi:hypothetical protein